MHPSRTDIEKFLEHSLTSADAMVIERHIDNCEFCRELVKNIRLWNEQLQATCEEPIPQHAREMAGRLFRKSIGPTIIKLRPISGPITAEPGLLAADGEKQTEREIGPIATFVSENPEIVLRIARGGQGRADRIQLIADNSAHTSNVLVQMPSLGLEFLTDEKGCAEIFDSPPENYESLQWQVKLPDAVFKLTPLAYDPDKVESSRETILESNHNDRIRIRLDQKTEGKLLSIDILELNGSREFGEVRVVVSQGSGVQGYTGSKHRPVSLALTDKDAEIQIRLFHQ